MHLTAPLLALLTLRPFALADPEDFQSNSTAHPLLPRNAPDDLFIKVFIEPECKGPTLGGKGDIPLKFETQIHAPYDARSFMLSRNLLRGENLDFSVTGGKNGVVPCGKDVGRVDGNRRRGNVCHNWDVVFECLELGKEEGNDVWL